MYFPVFFSFLIRALNSKLFSFFVSRQTDRPRSLGPSQLAAADVLAHGDPEPLALGHYVSYIPPPLAFQRVEQREGRGGTLLTVFVFDGAPEVELPPFLAHDAPADQDDLRRAHGAPEPGREADRVRAVLFIGHVLVS